MDWTTRWIKRWRKRLRTLLHKAAVERELDEELAFHLELETEKYVRQGLSPEAARRRARLAFGGVERHKEEVRDARWLAWTYGLTADLKLGVRMLRKYPGLTVVGSLAFACAIAVGAAGFELISQLAYPTLPLAGGDRIVALRARDVEANRLERRLAYELTIWNGALRTVEALGAYRTVGRNLHVPDGELASVPVAEISASAFRVAGVSPLLGRPLLPDDERPGAPPVLLIGHDAWRTRFAADPGVVGRIVRLDGVPHTIVGVMPEGFAFPFSHSWWTPLHLSPSGYQPGEGPAIQLFGRLAPGASIDAAQAELAAFGERAAADFPRKRAHLRAEVIPFAASIYTVPLTTALRAELASWNLLGVCFLVLVCGNVAMLTFARAATREGELVVRTALGASRGRIVMQLFAEALVLGTLAATLGLAAAGVGLRPFISALAGPGQLPFWIDARLSPTTVLYAAALTGLGAVVAGVMPALRVTRGLTARLKAASAGGGGLRFGGIWTAVIVGQVAVTVGFPGFAWAVWRDTTFYRSIEGSFPAREYLMTRLAMHPANSPEALADTAAARARFRAARIELERRVAAEPAVLGVTSATALPLTSHRWGRVEVEGVAPAAADSAIVPRVSSASVADDFFAVFGAPIVAGRGFHSGNFAADARSVIVNQSFVDDFLGGRSPIGRRVRYTAFDEPGDRPPTDAERGPWYEIVGVVPDLGMKAGGDPYASAGVYHPALPGSDSLLQLAVHVRGDPALFAQQLRTIAASVDPALRLDAVMPMDEVQAAELRINEFATRLLLVVSPLALTLSLAGIYAMLSFTVVRRTREIAIRVALGADPWRMVGAIVQRPITQVALGVVLGCVLLLLLQQSVFPDGISLRIAMVVFGIGIGLFAICLLACVVPARRVLAVEPMEALRSEG